jgi:hypothetical protein
MRMASTRWFTKRRTLVFACTVVLYSALWLLTQVCGVPGVRNVVLAAMEVPDSWTDVSHATTMPGVGEYCCRTAAYGPFLVRVDY